MAIQSDQEIVCEAFSRHFSKYQSEPLIIYGIGVMTKLLIDSFPSFNIVALMDETRAGESIYGKPIVPPEAVLALGVKRIVIVATANNTNIIFHRIAKFCAANGVEVYSIDGKRLKLRPDGGKFPAGKYQNINEARLRAKIDTADVVSFDVFDTLLMRKTLYPRDIFHIVARRGGIPDFYNARVKAETELYPGEAIQRIYDGVQALLRLSGAERERLLALEIETEKAFLVARDGMAAMLRYAGACGKPVYLVSDMYLPRALIAELLADKGISVPPERILVSCDFGVGKRGGLFKVLRRQCKGQKIVHIGDNMQADIHAAAADGIEDTFFAPSALEMLGDSPMADLLTYTQNLADRIAIGRFIAAQLNDPFLFSRTGGKLEVADNARLGQCFFAPIVLNYLIWLAEQVQKEPYDAIICSARDGWLIQQIIESRAAWRAQFPRLVYYHTSRKTAMRALLNDKSDILEVLKIKYAGSTADILTRNFALLPEELLPRETGETDEAYLLRHQPLILAHGRQTKARCRRYVQTLRLPPGAKLGYVDFTSSGTAQLALVKMTDFEVTGLYFMHLGGSFFIEEKDALCIRSLFEKQSYYTFSNKLLHYYTELENILTSYEPTVDDFDEDGKPIFALERRTDAFFEDLRVIHAAIADYCAEFDWDWLRDMSGAVSELLFSYLHADFTIQKASYFEGNTVYEDVLGRTWRTFGNAAVEG